MLRHLQQLDRKVGCNNKGQVAHVSPHCLSMQMASRSAQKNESQKGSSNLQAECQKGFSFGDRVACKREGFAAHGGSGKHALNLPKCHSNALAVGNGKGFAASATYRSGLLNGFHCHHSGPRGLGVGTSGRNDARDENGQREHSQSVENLVMHIDMNMRSNTMCCIGNSNHNNHNRHLIPLINVVGARGAHHHKPQQNGCEMLARRAVISSAEGANVVFCELYNGNNNAAYNETNASRRTSFNMQTVRALFARRKSKGGSGRASFSNGVRLLQNVGLHINRQHMAKPAATETGGRSERDIKRGRRIVRQVCFLYFVVLL